ncbi:MAG: hypothetical protein IT383_15335 [Deltaproteobacteria bacterium]|nr:hypothetical protein [Deltaproteobacteria bacterium]
MAGKHMLVILGAALLVSLAANLWLAFRAAPFTPGEAAADSAPSTATHADSGDDAVTSLAALLRSVAASRAVVDAPSPTAPPSTPPPPAPRALVDGFAEARVTRALIDDVQCRIAREKAAEAWRKEASALRASLMRSTEPNEAGRAAELASRRAQLADVIGVDEGDARVAELADRLVTVRDEAKAELHRLMTQDPPDWRAALYVVRGVYRQEDGAVLHAFGPTAADDWRMSDVDGRAAALAIGASLVGVPWASVDDRTPPAGQ